MCRLCDEDAMHGHGGAEDEIAKLREQLEHVKHLLACESIKAERAEQRAEAAEAELVLARDALSPKPPREGLRPAALRLERTHQTSAYWYAAGCREELVSKAEIYFANARNHWMNAAYAMADAAEAAEALSVTKILKCVDGDRDYYFQSVAEVVEKLSELSLEVEDYELGGKLAPCIRQRLEAA